MSLRPENPSFPLPGKAVALLCLCYLLFGLVRHDPWKTDDVINISLAYGFRDGDWLIPSLAGEIWLGTAPLYHWVAAIFGILFKGILPWHDAARLASGVFAGLGLYALYWAARGFHGREAGLLAPLLAIGSLGFLVPSHEAQPALIGFLSTATLLAALANWKSNRALSGASLGVSLGLGFLGTGLGMLIFLGTITMTAAMHPRWQRTATPNWSIALLVAIPLVMLWPVALWLRGELLFETWWATTWSSFIELTALNTRRFEILGWATWPVLPLSLWTLWLQRDRILAGRTFIPLIATLFGIIFFLRSSNLNDGFLPLIAALCVLGSAGAGRLRRGAANALDWFGGMTLTLFIGVIWLGGIAILTGMPARVAKNFTKPAPGFIAEWSWPALIVAVLVTLGWLFLLFKAPRSPERSSIRWSLGICTLWILLVTLWLPWIEYGKTYRSASADFRRVLGPKPGCIERQGLGPSQRASLDYFEGIRTLSATSKKECRYRIVQTSPRTRKNIDGWKLVLETARPGEKNESLRLYHRQD